MAILAVLAGGVSGFFCAIFGLFALNLTMLSALSLWWSAGSLVALLLVAAYLIPRSDSAAGMFSEQA